MYISQALFTGSLVICTIEGPLGKPLKREKEKKLVKKINLRTSEKDN